MVGYRVRTGMSSDELVESSELSASGSSFSSSTLILSVAALK
jgi:hypothetical protein